MMYGCFVNKEGETFFFLKNRFENSQYNGTGSQVVRCRQNRDHIGNFRFQNIIVYMLITNVPFKI